MGASYEQQQPARVCPIPCSLHSYFSKWRKTCGLCSHILTWHGKLLCIEPQAVGYKQSRQLHFSSLEMGRKGFRQHDNGLFIKGVLGTGPYNVLCMIRSCYPIRLLRDARIPHCIVGFSPLPPLFALKYVSVICLA